MIRHHCMPCACVDCTKNSGQKKKSEGLSILQGCSQDLDEGGGGPVHGPKGSAGAGRGCPPSCWGGGPGDFPGAFFWGNNRVRRQSGFPTFISCQRQGPNVLPKRRQSHQGDKLCDVSTVPLVARWPVFLARRSDADGEPHWIKMVHSEHCLDAVVT